MNKLKLLLISFQTIHYVIFALQKQQFFEGWVSKQRTFIHSNLFNSFMTIGHKIDSSSKKSLQMQKSSIFMIIDLCHCNFYVGGEHLFEKDFFSHFTIQEKKTEKRTKRPDYNINSLAVRLFD